MCSSSSAPLSQGAADYPIKSTSVHTSLLNVIIHESRRSSEIGVAVSFSPQSPVLAMWEPGWQRLCRGASGDSASSHAICGSRNGRIYHCHSQGNFLGNIREQGLRLQIGS